MQMSDGPPPPKVVAVLGSCATRDNFNRRFNPTYRESYTCDLAQNQTSMISLMSEPVLEEWAPLGEMSDYDRWNVTTEFTKSFLTDLAELKPAYVIVDFFADIHFGVLRLADGRYVTDNRWKVRKTDWYDALAAAGGFQRLTIFNDTDEFLRLWQEAFDRFVAFVAVSSPDTKVIVHRGFNTNRIQLADRPRPVKLQKHKPALSRLNVPRANELWRRLDDFAIQAADAQVIDLTGTDWTTYEEHPWGPFYVHFPPEYNHRFLAELHKITLHEHVPGWLMQRIDEIEAPRVEVAESDHRASQQVIQSLRRRVQAAERAGDQDQPDRPPATQGSERRRVMRRALHRGVRVVRRTGRRPG